MLERNCIILNILNLCIKNSLHLSNFYYIKSLYLQKTANNWGKMLSILVIVL